MVKQLNCFKCNKNVGEMTSGKIHRRARIYCENCSKTIDYNQAMIKIGNTQSTNPLDILNNITKGYK